MNKRLAVLQVEDSQSDASLILRLLENAGYDLRADRVETAAQMRAALARQDWDVVIADYHLPQFDAPAALAVLREDGRDIPFIVVSGAVGEDRAVAMMKAGAQDYVMKSSLARLVPAVEREIQEAQVRRERQLADEALRAAHQETKQVREFLDAVYSALTDAVVVCDRKAIVIRSNPAAAAIFGFDPNGMKIAALLEKLKLPTDQEYSITQKALAGESIVHLEQTAPDRTFETSSLPMRGTAGQIIGAVTLVRDITGRKLGEQRLRQMEKLESIALLAGGIAHDFNNLLTVVSGNISLVLDESPVGGPASSLLLPALESLRRAACLTRQLLAYAGKGSPIRKPVSVSGVAAQTVALLRPTLPERIRLVTDLASGLPVLLTDPGHMELVFSNLIVNAAEAIPGGRAGLVTIRTGLDNGSLRIEISDDGCGIDGESRKRIFDPFFTTKFAGRGLGLAAVEGIVRMLGGSIEVDSEVGSGTRIQVLIPAPESAPASPPADAVSDAESGKGFGTVLIVDDEPMIRRMATTFLKKRGIPVLEASSAAKAIELLSTEPDAVRALVVDMAMPDITSDAALEAIRTLRPEVRVIVTSGHEDNEAQQHFNRLARCEFLPKPYTPGQLLAAVLPAVSPSEGPL